MKKRATEYSKSQTPTSRRGLKQYSRKEKKKQIKIPTFGITSRYGLAPTISKKKVAGSGKMVIQSERVLKEAAFKMDGRTLRTPFRIGTVGSHNTTSGWETTVVTYLILQTLNGEVGVVQVLGCMESSA